MRYLIYLAAIIFLVGLNLGLFSNFKIGGQIPNLLFLLVVCFSLEKKDFDFIFIAFACGLYLDFYSVNFFGGFTLAFLLSGMILHLFGRNFAVSGLNWRILSLVLVLSLAFLDLTLWLYGLLAFKFNWALHFVSFQEFVKGFLPSLVYNLLLLYPMYLVTAVLEQFVHNLEARRRGVVR